MIQVYNLDGSVQTREVMSFSEAQEVVGGYVEVVRIPLGGVLLVNEEGRLREMAPNVAASRRFGILLVGPVVHLTDESCDDVLGSG